MTRIPMAELIRRRQIVVVGVVAGSIVGAAELVGGAQPPEAILTLVIIVTYALLVFRLQGHSETMAVFAGRPVDERWKAIHEHALGFTAQIGVLAALGGFVATELRHGDSGPYQLMAAVLGLSYIGGVLLYRWRT